MTAAVTPGPTPERVLRRLEWRVVRRLEGRLQGDHRSLFRGAGVDVADLREYQPDDDLRHIDWNVTARTDVAHVRQYVAERDVTAWLVLDTSPSMAFGPVARRKHVVLTELAATVARLLARGGNRVGAVLFDAGVERTVPPGQGRDQVLRILTHLIREPARGRRPGSGPEPGTTDLAVPLRALAGIARRRSVVVVLSDFHVRPGWEVPLAQLARRHDVLAVRIVDRREYELPPVGTIYVEDCETGEQIFVDTSDPGFQRRLRAVADQRQEALAAAARSAGVDLFTVATDSDLVRSLVRIARSRRRRPA